VKSREIREYLHTTSIMKCMESQDCSQFIDARIGTCNTTAGICHCEVPACFVYNEETNHCDLRTCHALTGFTDSGKIMCVNRGGKSKTVALVLNIFSFTGAVNFYLGNYGEAITQLIFLKIFSVSFITRVGVWICVCRGIKNGKGRKLFFRFTIVDVIFFISEHGRADMDDSKICQDWKE